MEVVVVGICSCCLNRFGIVAVANQFMWSDTICHNEYWEIYEFSFRACRNVFLILSERAPPFPGVVGNEVFDPLGALHLSDLCIACCYERGTAIKEARCSKLDS